MEFVCDEDFGDDLGDLAIVGPVIGLYAQTDKGTHTTTKNATRRRLRRNFAAEQMS